MTIIISNLYYSYIFTSTKIISTPKAYGQGMSVLLYYKGYGPLNVQAYPSLMGYKGYHYGYSDGYGT
jgi:hypothetical protein